MIYAAAKAYAEAVRPARDASETKQGFAKLLREAARPLVSMAAPSDDGDLAALDGAVTAALAEARILPDSDLGLFARRRVEEMAQLGKRPKAPAREPKDTLRDDLRAVVRAVGARSHADLPRLDEAVSVMLKDRGIDPKSRAGIAARMRAKGIAMLPWQMGIFAGSWTPSDFPSLTGWWAAEDLSGQSDGTDVTAWADKSGNGYNWGQRGSGNYPDKETVSGVITVEFAIAQAESLDLAQSLSTMIGNAGLAAVVCELSVMPPDVDSYALVLGDANTAGDDGGYFWIYALNQASSPKWKFTIYDGSDHSFTVDATIDAKALLMLRRDSGGTMYASIDGGTEQTTSSGAPATQTNNLALGPQVFGGFGGRYFSGRIYEAVTSTSNGTADDRANLVSYLKSKYNL